MSQENFKHDRQAFRHKVSKARQRLGLHKPSDSELQELFKRHLSFEPAAQAAIVATDYELEAVLRENGL